MNKEFRSNTQREYAEHGHFWVVAGLISSPIFVGLLAEIIHPGFLDGLAATVRELANNK